jgi:hypothetical protein
MVKVYQIFIDGAMGWYTLKPSDFEDEIIDAYFLEHSRHISKGKFIKIMQDINNMDIGDNIEFDNVRVYCFEIEEAAYNALHEDYVY